MPDELNEHQRQVEATKKAINHWANKTVEKKEQLNEGSMSFFGFNSVSGKDIKKSKQEFSEWRKAYQSLKEAEYTPMDDVGLKSMIPQKQSTFMGTDVSPGHDAATSPTEPVRVTNNFSDGPKIRQLSELKKQIEALERTLHEVSVKGDKKKADKLTKDLKKMRDKADGVSSHLIDDPFIDMRS
jgi:hypothetical protein